MAHIGEEEEVIEVVPQKDPLPQRENEPAHIEEPAPKPDKERELVPA